MYVFTFWRKLCYLLNLTIKLNYLLTTTYFHEIQSRTIMLALLHAMLIKTKPSLIGKTRPRMNWKLIYLICSVCTLSANLYANIDAKNFYVRATWRGFNLQMAHIIYANCESGYLFPSRAKGALITAKIAPTRAVHTWQLHVY